MNRHDSNLQLDVMSMWHCRRGIAVFVFFRVFQSCQFARAASERLINRVKRQVVKSHIESVKIGLDNSR